MKKTILKRFNINKESVKKVIQQALSPAFLVILLGAFVLWYTSKLGYEYTTEIPLNVRVDGQKYKVTTVVNGRGSTLMAQKLLLKSKINLKKDELSPRPSMDNPEALTFRKDRLLTAINSKVKDFNVIEIIDAPEFTPDPPKETGKERRARKREQELEEASESSE